MNIVRIHVNGFGKLHHTDLQLAKGLNLLIGDNEAGKSTLHLFLRSMLYGLGTKRRNGQPSAEERMRPWKDPQEFGGWLELEDEGRRYRITRDFDRAPDDLQVCELADSGEKSLSPEEGAGVLQKLLRNVSETAYVNTVSAGQLSAATERNMSGELRRYAANVSTTASPDLNADRAIGLLKEERSRLEASLDMDAAREYTGLLSNVRKLEENLDRPDYVNNILDITESGRVKDAEAAKVEAEIRAEEAVIGERRQILGEAGLDSREKIDQTRDSVLGAYGSWQTLSEKCRRDRSGRTFVILVIAAVILAAFGWKFREEYLCVIFLILAAGCLALGAMLLHTGKKNQRLRQQLDSELREKLSLYTDSTEPGEEAIHSFENRMHGLRKAAEELDEAGAKKTALQDELIRINAEQKVCGETLEKQREARTRVEENLRELNSMHEEAAALRRKLTENDLVRDRIEAVDLAVETLEMLKEDISSAVGTYINQEASRMVGGLTGGAYTSVNAGKQYDISLNSHDGMIPIGSVSAGTADQVYLALRLATIRFIAGGEDAMPLILDDSFALYDDMRLRRAVRFLADNYHGQILIFTCQHREEEALKAEGLSCHILNL